jgi:hypothetical protein
MEILWLVQVHIDMSIAVISNRGADI